MDDYQRVYFLCCGFISGENDTYHDLYFSELCVLYGDNYTPDYIKSHFLHSQYFEEYNESYGWLPYASGSVRLFKNDTIYQDIIHHDGEYPIDVVHNDMLMHFIKTKTVHKFNRWVPNIITQKSLIYNDDCAIYMHFKHYNSDDFNYTHGRLYKYYADTEYDKGDKYYDTICILNLSNPRTMYIMNYIRKYKHIWKYVYNNDELGFYRQFMDKYFNATDMKQLFEDYYEREYDFLFNDWYYMISEHFDKIKHHGKYVYRLKMSTYMKVLKSL
jgi:hypothetical protein